MPDPSLQTTALRYAAGDLAPDEASAFESRLAEDQAARDALSEAVRLSAKAIGQKPPAPHPSLRAVIRERLSLRAYRGHPFAWIGLGALAVAACTVIGLTMAERGEPEANTLPVPTMLTDATAVPAPGVTPLSGENGSSTNPDNDAERSVAEIWADLSNHENVEKARDDEMRWRQRFRDTCNPSHVSDAVRGSSSSDVREP